MGHTGTLIASGETDLCLGEETPQDKPTRRNRLLAHVGNTHNEFFVPDLFYIECTNTFWKYIRAGRYDAADLRADLATLKALRLRVISTADLMEDAATIALTHGISAYEASYVALSHRVGATLLTLDQRLVRALAATSYNVCAFNEFEVPPLS